MGGHNLTRPFPHALQIELARSSASRQPSISRTRRRHHQKPEPLLHLPQRSCGWRALIELAHFLLRTVQLYSHFTLGRKLSSHTRSPGDDSIYASVYASAANANAETAATVVATPVAVAADVAAAVGAWLTNGAYATAAPTAVSCLMSR